jgi:hypothetical protein
MLILKIIFLKIYYFNTFLNKIHLKKTKLSLPKHP